MWTYDDITAENFPFTYKTLMQLLEENKNLKKNFLVKLADIMRIEILYRHGGNYFDFKVEGFKSFLPFLKFKQWVFNMDLKKFDENNTLIEDGALAHGCVGSIPGHPHFKEILETRFRPGLIHMADANLFETTGGRVAGSFYSHK